MTDARPSGIPELKVNTTPAGVIDGRSMEVYWGLPSASNGVITQYILYDDRYVVYQGLERKALIRRLQPFTNYTFQLAVCNSAGCVTGPKQVLTSGEVTPKGQMPPNILYKNASSVALAWKPPLYPNGKIVLYQVIREVVTNSRRRRSEIIVYSVNETTKSSYSFVDASLSPFTVYRYKIRTVNALGSIDSNWVIVKTCEAPPEGLSKVNLTALRGPNVQANWLSPAIPNGVNIYYDIYRNNNRIDSTSSTHYIDKTSTLTSNTKYKYEVSACTAAVCTKSAPKCTKSAPAYITTLQSAPQDTLPPILTALGPKRLKATWVAPLTPNGDIEKYQLFLSPSKTPIFEGYAFTRVVSGLDAFTKYTLTVSACTVHGCTVSRPAEIVTLEDIPDSMDKPTLFVLGAYSIEAKWTAPAKPNGIIRYYVLQRDGVVVYNGTDKRFMDGTVSPGNTYGYTVSAYNSAGGKSSAVAYSHATNPGAPQNITAPVLTPMTSSSILAKWIPPGIPNGIITGYRVLFDNREIPVSGVLRYTGTNLLPFTLYEFRIKACTVAACTSSPAASAKTLETTPEEQIAPYFSSQYTKSNSIRARWYKPRKPHGIIKKYILYRRQQTSNKTLVYTGPDTSFTDSTPAITPNTRYEYQVVSHNSVGSVESPWSAVTTMNALPQDVQPLSVNLKDITKTSFVYIIIKPGKPNGEIKKYIVEVIGLRNETTTLSSGVMTDLQPFTTYKIRLYACNLAGCIHSTITNVTTKTSAPTGFTNAPNMKWITSTGMRLEWMEPLYSNGQIERYCFSHKCLFVYILILLIC